ncbi:MAG: S-layer homology domain-containing protein, partial [Oscillospiraceae bacterium]|nr:S-layer homology domain-containing protein [Oscillospiraceae bacterium]
LLVRAFEKESDNTENFADVSESDYFAKELAIARNTGLVGGVGDNKFAPRENIKRCDMMLMVYRVLKDKFVGADIIRPEYEDFDSVPDYAKEAVSALIGAGLVNGKNNLIAPNDNTTRAEVAVLLQRVLEFVENRAE